MEDNIFSSLVDILSKIKLSVKTENKEHKSTLISM